MNPFELVIIKLQKLGAFNFLFPFILTSAIFYGLLRKSKLFGEPEKNVTVNGIVALTAAFMVWAYPVLSGVNIEVKLSSYFFFGTIAILTFTVALLLLSMLVPEGLGKFLAEKIGEKYRAHFMIGILITGLLIGFSIITASGFLGIFIPKEVLVSEEFATTIFTIIIFIVTALVLVWVSK